MLLYLLNVSAAWLLSLIIFDLFLCRETFHKYNRFYLLLTLLIGVFLPLWAWQSSSTVYKTPLGETVQQAAAIKASILKASTTTHSSFSSENYLWVIYFAGVFICLTSLIIEITGLSRLYSRGQRSSEGRWTIIETGKEHAPFSIFNSLFVCSKEQYNKEQWDIICRHEEQHWKSFHFIDLCILQLSRIAFWFHPLVYVYHKRLLLIHEYQADAIATSRPAEYGQFLIEQALLQPAPSLSHSFNRSPIKNRIIMLTHRTSSLRHSAKILLLPLLFVFLVCCTKTMNMTDDKPVKNGNIVTYKGNVIELAPIAYDTFYISLEGSDKRSMKIVKKESTPMTLNQKKIFHEDLADRNPQFAAPYKDLRDYLLKNMKNELINLPEGSYKMHISNVVTDENGKLVYFEYSGITRGRTSEELGITNNAAAGAKQSMPVIKTDNMILRPTTNSEAELDKNIQNTLDEKIYSLLQNVPSYTPGLNDGKAVPSIAKSYNFGNYFKVKDHQLLDFSMADKDFIPL